MNRPDYFQATADFNAALARKRAASPAMAKTVAALEEQAKITGKAIAIHILEARRDGVIPPADKIVLQCLRSLRDIPEAERDFGNPDRLMSAIANVYAATSEGSKEARRRITALMRISLGE